MTLNEIRKAYIDFFKKRGHAVIPSASLLPQDDPTTLFTGSGMQPLVPYLLGKPHPKGTRLVDAQKCFRAEDIEEVGDNRHTTFFEMLGNWSLGDYFKEEQLRFAFEFLTDSKEGLGLDPSRLYVTVFAGDERAGVGKDMDSIEIWKKLFAEKGIEAEDVHIGNEEEGYKRGMGNARIFAYDAKKNWWSRAGTPVNMPVGEPGGPDSEVFFDFGIEHDFSYGKHCHPNCDCGRFLEIANSVFMEFQKREDGSFKPLPQKNVDFGAGLERLVMVSNDNPDIIASNHAPIVKKLEELSGKRYGENPNETHAFRIVADHIKGAVFAIADGALPSNTDSGYVTRRLIRRAVRYADVLGVRGGSPADTVDAVSDMYEDAYPEIEQKKESIRAAVEEEARKFRKTLARGLRELEKLSGPEITSSDAFKLFSTYGFPFELTRELATERGLLIDEAGLREETKKHQETSRAGAAQKFKGGLADAGEETVKLHTATHLMLAGLRKYLGEHVHQAGSNITAKRTRFDFTHPEKVERETLDRVEAYVNEAMEKGCTVENEQMLKEEAQKSGVEGSFWERYPDTVNVYKIVAPDGSVYSQELCGGPHVENTKKIGEGEKYFKIIKEEAVSAGIRRIQAVLE